MQQAKQAADPAFVPLNIACVFSPPAEGDADVKQMQQDLPQEKKTTRKTPKAKRPPSKPSWPATTPATAPTTPSASSTCTTKDVQKRIKDQQWPQPADFPAAKKIDITIVVDMLLTGFDSKYLNTLYVDKNLKYHGLIQAFSRTNRVLNGTKPYGNILDFRQQQANVDEAIALFSGEKTGEQAREIWLVDKAPVVIQKLDAAVQSWPTSCKARAWPARPRPCTAQGRRRPRRLHQNFKEVQRLKTQLDQYTDLTADNTVAIEAHPARRAPASLSRVPTSKPPSASKRNKPSTTKAARTRAAPPMWWTSSTLSLCCSPARDRLRLHHGPHVPLLAAGAAGQRQAKDDQGRAASA
jgi:type I restriction enzyme R subunit